MAKQNADTQRNRSNIVDDLERLTKQDGFVYAFCFLVFENLWLSPDEIADVDWYARPNSEELSFLLGLFVKHPIRLTLPHSPQSVRVQMESACQLLEELHTSYVASFPHLADMASDSRQWAANADRHLRGRQDSGEPTAEATFYSGPGAFDFQYLELSARKYAKDGEWILNHLGVSLESVIDATNSLQQLFNARAQNLQPPTTFVDQCHQALSLMSFTAEDIGACVKTADAIVQQFSLVPGTINQEFNTPGAYNRVLSHPIVQLENGTYFLPIHADLCRSIYESPFYWILEDPVYVDTGLFNRGETTERIASEMLEGVFGKGNVYRDVKVRNGTTDVTDIDVLTLAGNKAIVVQAKSKKMTEVAKKGDPASVRRDFREAVQEAYEQGLVSRAALVGAGATLEDDRGQPILLHHDVDDAYIICLTGDYYPAVMHQVDIYLNKGTEEPFPLAVSVFDLEMLCFYLDDPFELLYYLRQRTVHATHFRADSEMSLLAFHLKHRLHPPGNSDWTYVQSEYGQLFDANYPAATGHAAVSDVSDRLFHQWRNDEFNQLINDVKAIPNPRRADLLFFLFDLVGSGADNVFERIARTKQATIHDGESHDVSMLLTSGNRGITFMSFPSASASSEERLQLVANARKYKSRANEWLGLGWSSGSSRLVDMIWYSNEPWEPDPELERLAQQALGQGTMIRAKGRKIGKNEPCPCGSGVKYKKCHGR